MFALSDVDGLGFGCDDERIVYLLVSQCVWILVSAECFLFVLLLFHRGNNDLFL